MPRTKSKSSGNKPLPANQQKGEKYAHAAMKKIHCFFVITFPVNKIFTRIETMILLPYLICTQ